MKDSDWTIAGIPEVYLNNYKTIYSESNSTVKASESDINVCYWFDQGFESPSFFYEELPPTGLVLGYLSQSFSWEASDVDQWYPLFPWMPHDKVAGIVGTYSADIRVPYAAVASKLIGEKFNVTGILGYSPLASVEDRDDHILRTILAKSKATGHAFIGTFFGRYDLTSSIFCGFRADFMILETDGKADTIVYAGADKDESWTIDHKVDSTNYSASLSIGYRF